MVQALPRNMYANYMHLGSTYMYIQLYSAHPSNPIANQNKLE